MLSGTRIKELQEITYNSPENFVKKLIKYFNKSDLYKGEKRAISNELEKFKNEKGFNTYSKKTIIDKVITIEGKVQKDSLKRFIGKLSFFINFLGIKDIKIKQLEEEKLNKLRSIFEPILDEAFESMFQFVDEDSLIHLLHSFTPEILKELKDSVANDNLPIKELAESLKETIKEL